MGYKGRGKTLSTTMLYGDGVKITPEMIPDVTKQPDLMQAAADAGRLLGQRLRQGHDRMVVTRSMQAKLMAMFGESA